MIHLGTIHDGSPRETTREVFAMFRTVMMRTTREGSPGKLSQSTANNDQYVRKLFAIDRDGVRRA